MIIATSPYQICQRAISFSANKKENIDYSRTYLSPLTMQSISALESAYADIIRITSLNQELKFALLDSCKNISINDDIITLSDDNNNCVEFSTTYDDDNKAFVVTSINNDADNKFSLVFSNNKLINVLDNTGKPYEAGSLTSKDVENLVTSISDSIDSLILAIRQFLHNSKTPDKSLRVSFNLPTIGQSKNPETKINNFYYQDLISTKIKKRIEVDEEIKPRKKYRSRKKKIVVTKDDFKPAIDKKASGVLSVDYKAKLNLIHSLHKDIVELRSKLSYSDMLKIQEQLGETINYKGDVVVIGDKDKKRIMVHYPKSDMYPDKTFTKICFIKPGNIFGYGHLFENDKIVKNYDFNEPYSMPFMLKYCSQKEMDEILSDKNFIYLIKTAINKMIKLKEKLESSKNI